MSLGAAQTPNTKHKKHKQTNTHNDNKKIFLLFKPEKEKEKGQEDRKRGRTEKG